MTDETTDNGMDRRNFIRRAGTVGAAGAMVWAAPSVTTLSRAFGQEATGSPDCGSILELIDDMEKIGVPPSARRGDLVDATKVRIWFEGYGNSGGSTIPLSNPTGVTGSPTSIGPNTAFAVYLIHAQQPTPGATGVEQRGGVRFTAPILGVTSTAAGLAATDVYGPDIYDTSGLEAEARRFEEQGDPNADTGVVAGNTVNVVTKQGGYPDQMRVFVACSTAEDV